jgi:hypothetical protein
MHARHIQLSLSNQVHWDGQAGVARTRKRNWDPMYPLLFVHVSVDPYALRILSVTHSSSSHSCCKRPHDVLISRPDWLPDFRSCHRRLDELPPEELLWIGDVSRGIDFERLCGSKSGIGCSITRVLLCEVDGCEAGVGVVVGGGFCVRC